MAVWKSVEYNEVTLDVNNTPVTTNLSKGQDETQCTPFVSYRNTGPISDKHFNRLAKVEYIDNAGTPAVRVTAGSRDDADDTVYQIFTVEWDASIAVEQVTVSGFTAASTNVTITDVVDQTTAFLYFSYEHDSSGDDHNDAQVQVRFNGSSTTSVTLSRRDATGSLDGTLYVVKCSSTEFIVDHRELDVTSSSATSDTDTITSTTSADTFLVHSYETSESSDDMRDFLWQADLQNDTTVRIRRTTNSGTPSATSTHSVAVVEAQGNEWDVQRNDAVTMSSASVTDTITEIDQDRSYIVAMGPQGKGCSCGRNNSTNGGNINGSETAGDFSSDTLVRMRKKDTTLTNEIISYEAIQFATVSVVTPINLVMAPYMPA